MANDTAALVVALSAQLTKFEKDMKNAVGMAERATNEIEGKFNKINPSLSTTFLGNFAANLATKAFDAAVKAVEELIDRFQKLGKTAEYAGVSMNWLYGLQQVLGKAGASAEDVNVAMKAIAYQLDLMKRGGEGPLKQLLDANPQALKGLSRDSLTVEQTWGVIAGLIANAQNQVQAFDMAKNLGLPDSVVAGFEKYGASLKAAADDAARSAPDLQKIAEYSKEIQEAWTKFAEDTKNAILAQSFEYLKAGVEGLLSVLQSAAGASLQYGTMLGAGIEAALVKVQALAGALDKIGKNTKANELPAITMSPKKGGGTVDPFGLGGGGGESRAFDKQIESIEKHTARLQADAATVGESAGQQEEYRIQIQLTEAALTQYGEVTGEVSDKIAALSARAGAAKQQEAERMHMLQQLNSASQQFGNALANSFADAILEGKKLNEVMSDLLKTIAKAILTQSITSLFAPGAGETAGPLAKLFGFGGGKQGGGPVTAGTPYLVGEHGPELMVPKQAGMIMPNNVLGAGGFGATSVVYSPAIDARGASVEAVARLAQILEQDRASFASRTVATIQQAKRGRVPGL